MECRLRRHPDGWQSERLCSKSPAEKQVDLLSECQVTDIFRRVYICVVRMPTRYALKRACVRRFLWRYVHTHGMFEMYTVDSQLRLVCHTSLLIFKHRSKFKPGHFTNGFRYLMILDHIGYLQIFYPDHIVVFDDARRDFLQVIRSCLFNFFVQSSYFSFLFLIIFRFC